jgi:ethanolamine ammonia-lyase large subunit
MKLSTRLFGASYRFRSVRELLARANEARSGDELAGIAARSEKERIAAKTVLADLTLNDLRENPVVPYDRDEVTRVIDDALDRDAFASVRNKTVGEFRQWLLDDATTGDAILAAGRGITAEIAAAVAKLSTNLDLITIAAKIRVVTKARTTLGLDGRLSTRLQPNHPRDDLGGIAAATYEGLAYATGDALIGINPCIDTPENIRRMLELTADIIERTGAPTQNCVLGHITTQMRALEAGAPMDIMFQSLAGTEKGNAGFGITVAMLDDGYAMIRETGRLRSPNLMYFETGQGSELSAGAHEGSDQVTLEARCYGLARRYSPLLVNTVVGFIGPEYLYDAKQITRAGLEDHLMGKILGVPHGADACYTNHARADQNDCENLAVLMASAGCNYFMAVPMGDDVMLSYQSTSYHDASALRAALKMRPAPEFEAWCEQRGILHEGRLTPRAGNARLLMNSSDKKVSGADDMDFAAMRLATPARLDVGRAGPRYTTPAMLALRADHARAVDAVMTEIPRDWARRNGLIEVHSEASTREDYLRYPERGRRIAAADIARVKHLATPRKRTARGKAAKATVLICVGDGLSSAAIEKNAKPLLKALERVLKSHCDLMKPIFIRNARVRIEDHLGEIIRPEVICMIVGERPGLATAESLSAYVIYRPTLKSIEPDRSVISNIHRGGIPIPEAARKIAKLIDDAIRFQATGAALAEKKPNP